MVGIQSYDPPVKQYVYPVGGSYPELITGIDVLLIAIIGLLTAAPLAGPQAGQGWRWLPQCT